MKEKYPKRKQIRLENYDYSSVGIYFITICTAQRKYLLSKILKKKTGIWDTLRKEGVPVLFAKGEFYCLTAVILLRSFIRLRRVLKANKIKLKRIAFQ